MGLKRMMRTVELPSNDACEHGVSPSNVDEYGGECPWCLLNEQALAAALDKQAMEEIRSGMFQWEPGTLPPETLNRILIDVLADVWNACPKDEAFAERVCKAAQHATGYPNEPVHVPIR